MAEILILNANVMNFDDQQKKGERVSGVKVFYIDKSMAANSDYEFGYPVCEAFLKDMADSIIQVPGIYNASFRDYTAKDAKGKLQRMSKLSDINYLREVSLWNQLPTQSTKVS